jgi:hypothetical protein
VSPLHGRLSSMTSWCLATRGRIGRARFHSRSTLPPTPAPASTRIPAQEGVARRVGRLAVGELWRDPSQTVPRGPPVSSPVLLRGSELVTRDSVAVVVTGARGGSGGGGLCRTEGQAGGDSGSPPPLSGTVFLSRVARWRPATGRARWLLLGVYPQPRSMSSPAQSECGHEGPGRGQTGQDRSPRTPLHHDRLPPGLGARSGRAPAPRGIGVAPPSPLGPDPAASSHGGTPHGLGASVTTVPHTHNCPSLGTIPRSALPPRLSTRAQVAVSHTSTDSDERW